MFNACLTHVCFANLENAGPLFPALSPKWFAVTFQVPGAFACANHSGARVPERGCQNEQKGERARTRGFRRI